MNQLYMTSQVSNVTRKTTVYLHLCMSNMHIYNFSINLIITALFFAFLYIFNVFPNLVKYDTSEKNFKSYEDDISLGNYLFLLHAFLPDLGV